MKVVALIPARSGSQRVRDKNVRELGGYPLIAWTIKAAKASNIFDAVICSTDSIGYAEVAEAHGAEVPFRRPPELSTADSPDIAWVEHALRELSVAGRDFDVLCILRPTSPFRTAATIIRAMEQFLLMKNIDSLRAVESVSQHPGKMWIEKGGRLSPLLPWEINGVPWHSSQTHSLPSVLVQNASLEIAFVKSVIETKSISGHAIMPFYTTGLEGFDINTEKDWLLAEVYLQNNPELATQ